MLQSLLMRWRLFLYELQCAPLNHPLILKLIFAVLRRIRPTTIVKKIGAVTKANDVRDVLDRIEDFNNAEELSPKLPWGPFIVEVDWPEQHDRERALLESAVTKQQDVDTIRQNAATVCQAQLGSVRSGEIEVVSALLEPVVVDMVQRYFGVPAMGEPHEAALILSRVAGIIMVEPPVGSKQWNDARDGIVQLTNAITQRIDQASGPTQSDDLLTRLVLKLHSGQNNPSWFDASWIRRHITGLTVFGGGTIVRAAAQAVDRLMAHPAGLQEACALAKQVGPDSALAPQALEEARLRLLQLIYEALRFRPMLPLLTRYVPRETLIAKGCPHARMAPAGCTMLAPPVAAMYDPDQFPKPWGFSNQRGLKDYVHFGYGSRLCFGKYIADVLFVEAIGALLRVEGLKRARGSRGRLKHEGPAARSLVLTFNH